MHMLASTAAAQRQAQTTLYTDVVVVR